MAFTKVVGPGIHTLSNILSHNINSSGIITATKFVGPFDDATIGGGTTITSDGINVTGIVTATGLDINGNGDISGSLTVGSGGLDLNGNGDISGNLVLGGDLTVNGTTTTLDTNLIGVDRVEIGAAGAVVGLAVTQSGSADLVRLYDGSTQVVTVDDEGLVSIGKVTNQGKALEVYQAGDAAIRIQNNASGTGNNDGILLEIGSTTKDALIYNYESAHMRFGTAGTERVRITSGGFVGIGVTNPEDYDSAGKNLVVGSSGQEGITIRSSSPNTGNLLFNDGLNLIAGLSFKHSGVGTDRYFSFSINQGSGYVEQLRIQDGKLIMSNDQNTYMHNSGDTVRFTTGGTERFRINGSGNVKLPDSAELQFGGALHTGNGDLRLYHNSTDSYVSNSTGHLRIGNTHDDNKNIKFFTSGSTKWNIDSDGHFIPDTVGAVNIGSTGAEIGHVYLADDKKVYLGSDQDSYLYHNGSNHYITNTTGNLVLDNSTGVDMYINSGNDIYIRPGGAENGIKVIGDGAVELYYDGSTYGTPKIKTSTTGITVDGEVAASQDYPMVKPTLDCNFVLNKKLDPRIGFTRKGVASFYDEKGTLKIVGDNVPRFDHNPETRESLGILIEEQRTNLQPHSEQWSPNSADGWVNIASGMDVDYDPGVVTPTGETTGAITIMEAGASGQHYIAPDTFSATSGTTYTFSFFFKNISGNDANNLKFISSTSGFSYVIRTFYFSGSDVGTVAGGSDSTITKLPNGWWRGTVTLTANSTNTSSCHFDIGRGLNSGAAYNNKVAIWGYQVEVGAFPTSYIRTGNSDYGRTATRGVDFLQIQGQAFTDLYNPVESTILCSYQHTKEIGSINASVGGDRRVYRFGTGATSSDTRIDFVSTNTFHPYIARDASSPASLTATAPSTSDVNTYATRVKENDFATTKAGGSIASDTSGNWDPVNKMTEVQIGGTWNGASTNALQAHYKRFTYYPVGLPNSQLITISS